MHRPAAAGQLYASSGIIDDTEDRHPEGLKLVPAILQKTKLYNRTWQVNLQGQLVHNQQCPTKNKAKRAGTTKIADNKQIEHMIPGCAEKLLKGKEEKRYPSKAKQRQLKGEAESLSDDKESDDNDYDDLDDGDTD